MFTSWCFATEPQANRETLGGSVFSAVQPEVIYRGEPELEDLVGTSHGVA
jgi:hypothetical protein